MERASAPHSVWIALCPVIRTKLVEFAFWNGDIHWMIRFRMLHKMIDHNKMLASSAGHRIRVARAVFFVPLHV